MSYVIDFNQDQQPHYILRVRGSSSGIIDLVGNTVTNHNVMYSTSSTLGNGTCLKFNGTNSSYVQVLVPEVINNNEDFTISAWINYSTYNAGSETNTSNILAVNADEKYGTTPWEDGNIWFWQERVMKPGRTVPFINIKGPIDELTVEGGRTSEPTNTWLHAAMCRKRNKVYMFRNGVLYHTENKFISRVLNKKYPVTLGMSRRYNLRLGLNGYLDDICIIKGKALWTSNFTPPTTYLPDDLDSI